MSLNFRSVGLIGALWLAGLVGHAGADPERLGPNLAANPSFEAQAKGAALPDQWRGSPIGYSSDTNVKRTGKASLKYVNSDPARYLLASGKVSLRPGLKYRFGVWVKTSKISGAESGATICLEWRDKAGKWMGGSYPSGLKGTCDWTLVESVVRVPDDAASFTLNCYVRKGMIGTAWFDDVEIFRIADPPMQSVLLTPIYRGRITATGPTEARVRVRLNLVDYPKLKPGDLRVCAQLCNQVGGKVGGETVGQPGASAGPVELSIATAGLRPGDYELSVRLIGPDDKVLQTAQHRLTRLADDFQTKCAIDSHRRLLVDGKPFFPIGMYWSSINEKDIAIYTQSKFNCLMPYGSPTREQMDLAERHGLKVIYSIKDWYAGSRWCPGSIKNQADEEPNVRRRVREFRDHPALLAWYLNDELPQSFMPRLEAHQRWVADEDPGHPTWVVLYQYKQVAAYLNTFDVIGTDPYPIGRKPASMAAEWTRETFRQVDRARPMWQVPQLHNWALYRKTEAEKRGCRTPTFDEVRSMSWQCICEGATGLVFYCWNAMQRNPDVSFDVQWEGLKRIAAEIDRAAPALLSIESVPELTVKCTPAPAEGPGWLNWTARVHDGKLYLFATNNGDGQGTVTFTLPATPLAVRVPAENRSINSHGKTFQDQLTKLAVRIYEIELPEGTAK